MNMSFFSSDIWCEQEKLSDKVFQRLFCVTTTTKMVTVVPECYMYKETNKKDTIHIQET